MSRWGRVGRRTAVVAGAALALSVGIAACGDDDSNASDECAAGDTIVEIKDDVFDPVTAEVTTGTTVCWPNEGRNEHAVEPDEGDLFGDDSIQPGEAYSYTFEDAGTYDYYCRFHGAPGVGQIGEIIVEGEGGAPAGGASTSSSSSSSTSSSSTSSSSTSTSTSTTSTTQGDNSQGLDY